MKLNTGLLYEAVSICRASYSTINVGVMYKLERANRALNNRVTFGG